MKSKTLAFIVLTLACSALALGAGYSRFGTAWTSGASHTLTVGYEVELIGAEAWNAIYGGDATNVAIYVERADYPGVSNLVGTITITGAITADEPAGAVTNSVTRGSGSWSPSANQRWFVVPTDTLYFIGPTQATVRVHSLGR